MKTDTVMMARPLRDPAIEAHLDEYLEGGRVSKVSRYKWTSTNEPGDLRYLPKGQLQVDHSYQRHLNDAKRKRIASEFNWAAFGVLIVARRNDGSLWVIDGQHRLAAAQSRADIHDVPVVVFNLRGSLGDEATDFLVANKERKPLLGVETFKAMVASGDPIALQAQTMIRQTGREISPARGAKSIACVNAVYRSVQQDVAALQRIWPLMIEISEGSQFDNRVLLGLFALERKLIDADGRPRSLAEAKLYARLVDAGFSAILRAIQESSAYYKRGGETVWARGILNIVNHKLQKRFSYKGAKDGA